MSRCGRIGASQLAHTAVKLNGSGTMHYMALHAQAERVNQEIAARKAAKLKAAEDLVARRKDMLLSDAEVLELRALHEFGGVPAETLCAKYKLERRYVTRLLDYTLRSKLIPKKMHLPQASSN